MCNYRAVIIIHFKYISNMLFFTYRLLESHHDIKCDLTINNGCQQIDRDLLHGLAKKLENSL